MTRPSLIHNDTRTKASGAEAKSNPPDLASFLTSDLRVKGAPSTPPAAETASSPAAVVVVPEAELGLEQSSFGAWLASDLRPRRSQPPPDSLAPQLVPPPEVSPEVGEAGAEPQAELEDDDFAVLPGRAGKRGGPSRGKRAVAALAVMLAAFGAVWLLSDRPAPSPLEGIAAGEAAAPLTVLPPPPPSELPPEPEPEPEAEPTAPVSKGPRRAAEPPPPLEEDDPLFGPRGRNWARYADLPSPTLSRLAREERELAKKRDEQRRLEAKRAKTPE